jgi:hypothetical protein
MWSLESYFARERSIFIFKVEAELMQKHHHEDRVARFVRKIGAYATHFM